MHLRFIIILLTSLVIFLPAPGAITAQTTDTPPGQNGSAWVDDRFPWQTLPGEFLRVHWYLGDASLAQRVQQTAERSLAQSGELIGARLSKTVDIYLYPDSSTLQDAVEETARSEIAGRAAPQEGIILVALPEGPEQQILVEQRVPHELMHTLLYQKTSQGYTRLPAWLSEGVASVAELYPNPDYPVLLNHAVEEGGLLPLITLCQEFPTDTGQALLAYAQSTSLVRFVISQYGTAGLQSLLEAYTGGKNCENAAQAALGVNLSELERQWRQEIYADQPKGHKAESFAPWLFLLVISLAAPAMITFVWLRKQSG